MDIIKEEQKNNLCTKHPRQQLLFFNVNHQSKSEKERLYLCDICLSEDICLQYADIISIRQIIDYGDKNILQKWPPVSNYQMLRELAEISSQNLDRNTIFTKISDCFTETKEQIVQQLDQLQKKITNKISDYLLEFDKAFERYQSLSKIDSLREILIENEKNNLNRTDDLKKLIIKLQSEKELNTEKLTRLLKKNKEFLCSFEGQYLNDLKDSLSSYLMKLNSYVFTDTSCTDSLSEEKIKQYKSYQKRQKELIEINKKAINSLTNQRDFEQSITTMVKSSYAESKDIDVIHKNGIIQLIPKTISTFGQLYSQQKINQNKIYEFIIGFKTKPNSYVCIGFEEEQLLNRYLGAIGKNSFILGQLNSLFCNEQVKGNKNLQTLCQEEFVETLVIQVLLSENKFYIADYPDKRAVNCMEKTLYKFQPDKNYYFTVQIQSQISQIDIISSRVIEAFTLP